MTIRPITTRIFQEGEDLVDFVLSYVKTLPENSILAITSKIVALAERRTKGEADLEDEHLIRQESSFATRTKHTWLTIKDGMIMASAGIDASNGNGKLVLLPRDSFAAARVARNALRKKFKVNNLGIVITDSRTMPLRAGTTGVALGYAGFQGIKDYRGTHDIFGRTLLISQVNVADSIAAALVLIMGEGAEQRPLAIATNAPVMFCDRIRKNELRIDIRDDMYRPLFSRITSSSRT